MNVTRPLRVNPGAVAELSITLIGPNGTRVPLISGAGGSNFTNTTFDDEAAIYAGTLRPQGVWVQNVWRGLSVFDQKPMNGTWTLEVTDNTRKNVGTILNWSLKASLIPPPPLDAASLDFLFGDGGRKR